MIESVRIVLQPGNMDKERKMATNQNRLEPSETINYAITYLLAGMLVYDTNLSGHLALVGKIMGGIFMGFAFLVMIASLFSYLPNRFTGRFTAWVDRIGRLLYLGLSIVSLGAVLIAGVKRPELVYVIAFFFVLTITTMSLGMYKLTTQLASDLGKRGAAIRILRVLSFIFGLFAFTMIIMQQSIYGGPVLYSALAVVLLSLSFLL